MKVINVVVTESTIFQRRYRVPDDFDVADAAAVEALFVHDERSVEGAVGVVGRDVKPVAVSALADAAFDVDYGDWAGIPNPVGVLPEFPCLPGDLTQR